MLSPREIQEMRALVRRISAGSVSREDWSALAALALMACGEETVVAIAARGLDEFITISQPAYEGHAFQHEDYRRMYDRICAAAARTPAGPVH